MKNMIWRVLTVAFAIRLLIPIIAFIHNQDYAGFHSNDTPTYLEPARALIFSGKFTSPIDGKSPELFRTPGYPLLLIPGILLNSPDWVTIGLQIILSCLTVYLIYKIALLLFNNSIAIACAALYAIEPLSIMYTSKIMAETLFACASTFFIYRFLKYLDSRSLKDLLIAAIALVASAYVRPINYYAPFLITIFLFVWALKHLQQHKILLAHACIFFVVSMGLISCWQIRNNVVAAYPGYCAITDVNLYFYKAPSILAVKNGTTFFEEQEKRGLLDREIYFKNHPEQRAWTQSEVYQYMGKEGGEIVKNNRLTYLGIHLKGMLRVLATPGTGEYTILFDRKEDPAGMYSGSAVDNGVVGTVKKLFLKDPFFFWLSFFLGLSLYSYLLFALTGLIFNHRLQDIKFIALLTIAAYFITVSGGPEGQSRFRHPIMPIICILAGYGLSAIVDKIGKKGRQNNTLTEEPNTTT